MHNFENDFLVSTPIQEFISSNNGILNKFISHFNRTTVVTPHFHKETEVIMPIGVKGEMVLSNKVFRLFDNQIYIVAPNAVHSFNITPERKNAIVYILQIDIQAFFERLPFFKHGTQGDINNILTNMPAVPNSDRELFHKTVLKLFDKTTIEPILTEIDTTINISTIIRLILSFKPTEEKKTAIDNNTKKIISIIEKEANEATSLDIIAKRSGLSKTHLCRVFKNNTGMTIHNYLTQLRINRACYLMDSGEKNMSTVCIKCGFGNFSHFIQVFRKKLGVSPKKWSMRYSAALSIFLFLK